MIFLPCNSKSIDRPAVSVCAMDRRRAFDFASSYSWATVLMGRNADRMHDIRRLCSGRMQSTQRILVTARLQVLLHGLPGKS